MAAFSVESAWRAGPANGGYWRAVAELREATTRASRGDAALGFVVASVLGQPAALAPERRTELRRAGLGHVVAVSGMNVAVAAALVQGPLLRAGLLLGGSLTLAAALAWLPVLAYLGMTGGEPPALRAAVMFGLAQLATLTGRPGHGLTALAWTAAAMLAWRPAWGSIRGCTCRWRRWRSWFIRRRRAGWWRRAGGCPSGHCRSFWSTSVRRR
ncbi:ComEC/Rec2 family competence protein [Nannocystis pusilla]|uniref:ComEC/Rec2 family competence protein n=1 Tax=Nannocystis pusilla TaxID=889268 RepID=UPI003B78A08B